LNRRVFVRSIPALAVAPAILIAATGSSVANGSPLRLATTPTRASGAFRMQYITKPSELFAYSDRYNRLAAEMGRAARKQRELEVLRTIRSWR